MKYFAEFHSIIGRPYRIEVITPSGSGTKELKLSGTPFVASVKGDDKHIYSPIRCGGATLGLLSKECLFDLYSGQAQGVKVTLFSGEDSEKVEWTGYIAPTMYDQGFDEEWEEINVDCVDGIAVLKDVPFRQPELTIMTFLDLIFYCLKASGCFRNFYISDNVQLKADGSDSVIEKFRISSSNFFNERKDMTQTDDDVAWSCYDVLYEICQWLGYTVVSEGDEVFIIDYDAIRNGRNTYYRYSLEDDAPGSGSRVSVYYNKAIQGSDYSGNNAKISLDEIYNKVTVKDEFHTYDNIFPAFGDEKFETNLTADTDETLSSSSPLGNVVFGDVIKSDPGAGVPEPFIFVSDVSDLLSSGAANFIKIMDSPVFNFHKYDRATRLDISSQSKWGKGNARYSDILNTNGAFYLKMFQIFFDEKKYNNAITDFTRLRMNRQDYDKLDSVGKINKISEILNSYFDPSKLSLSPVIVFLNTGANRFGPGDEKNYNDRSGNAEDVTKQFPFITLKENYNTSIFGGSDHFLRIKGKISYHSEAGTPHPLSNKTAGNLKRADDKKYGTQGYIWAKVKWGDRWWNGEEWKEEDCWFKLYYWDPETTTSRWKNKEHYAKEFEICTMNADGILHGESGYLIPAPMSGNLSGKPELSFTTRDMIGDSRRSHWGPKGTKTDNFYCRYFSECVLIKDLSVTAEVSTGFLSDADLDSDTLYTNVIENGSIAEMDQISFKVCTDDQKKPSYSSVDLLEGSESKFVSALYNLSLRDKESDTTGCDGLTACLRQEEHTVFKLARQYRDPRLLFECDLHNDGHKLYGTFSDASHGSRVFILSEREIDYRFNSAKLKLSEKA